ncbi:hypothetical protein [Streptomyces sp. NPDC041003]|uniref:hypothetical protein n=1 Tax=Streptomyces sp. NPDC041003 TaxID=3155730 RepID=UPI0033D9F1A5
MDASLSDSAGARAGPQCRVAAAAPGVVVEQERAAVGETRGRKGGRCTGRSRQAGEGHVHEAADQGRVRACCQEASALRWFRCRAGSELAAHLGVPFHFASPDTLDDGAPRWRP